MPKGAGPLKNQSLPKISNDQEFSVTMNLFQSPSKNFSHHDWNIGNYQNFSHYQFPVTIFSHYKKSQSLPILLWNKYSFSVMTENVVICSLPKISVMTQHDHVMLVMIFHFNGLISMSRKYFMLLLNLLYNLSKFPSRGRCRCRWA